MIVIYVIVTVPLRVQLHVLLFILPAPQALYGHNHILFQVKFLVLNSNLSYFELSDGVDTVKLINYFL